MSTILAVDDDRDVRATIGRALRREGHDVIEASDATAAITLASEYRPDLIILDITLADMNGLELCAQLRRMPYVNRIPILFLSVHQSAHHVAQALELGGDDYLRKPFMIRELNARVRALLRRAPERNGTTNTHIRLESEHNRAIINGQSIDLTPTEYNLLTVLGTYPGQFHTAEELLQRVWGYQPGRGDTALVRNHVRNLRRKIESDPDHPGLIRSLHGRGYSLDANVFELGPIGE